METLYIIPDLHGRLDLLNKAYDTIEEHSAGRLSRIIFLGDAIDRGPDSKGCIDRLIQGINLPNFLTQINLLGNHEEFMLNTLAGDMFTAKHWFNNGGLNTLSSYGVDDLEDFCRNMKNYIPQEHITWLKSLDYFYETSTHIFVHAGLFPGYSLLEMLDQHKSQLIWIREPFLSRDYDFGKHVVHGHSILGYVDSRVSVPPFRTNLDNGAYHTGILFLGVIEEDQIRPTIIELKEV